MLAALPLLSSLTLCCLMDNNITALTICTQLTALRLGYTRGLSALASLRDLDLACLSVQASMTASSMSVINSLSSFSRLEELHWRDFWRGSLSEAMKKAAAPQPDLSFILPNLTCLVLNGPVDSMRSLMNHLTRITGIQALGIYVHHGQASSFGSCGP